MDWRSRYGQRRDRLHPNCVAVDAVLEAAGLSGRVQILPEAAPTAAAAAAQLGVEVGAIANSLIFATAEGEAVLVLTSGAHRVDTAKAAALVGTARLTRARRSSCARRPGSPSAASRRSPIRHGCALSSTSTSPQFPQVWAAGGIPHAVFPTTYDELLRLTGGTPADVA